MKNIITLTLLLILFPGVVIALTIIDSENFDSESPDLNNTTCGSAYIFSGTWLNDLTDDNDWIPYNTATPSGTTGPTTDHSGTGNYVYVESSTTGCYGGKTSNLVSTSFNFSGYTAVTLDFWYHMYGTDMGTLSVDISTNGGTSWTNGIWSLSGDQGDSWNQAQVDLGAYTGGGNTSIKIRFRGVTGANFTSDMAIDDIELSGELYKFPWTMFLNAMTGELKVCSTDPQTKTWKGLEWQRCDNGEEYQWEAASNYCQNLFLGRHSDWRLPTKNELKNLVVCTNGHPIPMADYHWCSDGEYSDNFASPTIDPSFQSLATGYWTSTKQDAGHAWFVNFVGGNAEVHSLQNGHYVRCVRTP